MGVKWTENQKKVIELRNRNILVSAAAGSGKTAVLVERIMQMIGTEEEGVDIDRLLVVTYTNAAAAELKERIRLAIEKRLLEEPENLHLQKQASLVHHAQITTIHGFCLSLLREYFYTIPIDPGFRIGDEGELKLLKKEVLEALLEERFQEKDPDFLNFVECYVTGKRDDAMEALILQLHEYSMSYPEPEKWLSEVQDKDAFTDKESFLALSFLEPLLQYFQAVLEDLLSSIREGLELCDSADGPFMYKEALQSDLEKLGELKQLTTYEAYGEALVRLKFATLSRARGEVDAEKKELVKSIRDQMKKTLEKLKKQYFSQPLSESMESMAHAAKTTQVLLALVADFQKRYEEKKRSKNLVDFSDLEHYALKILWTQKEDGALVPSSVADDFAEYFQEIMIDEYQDSNFVQEKLLTSISKGRFGRNNVFMVGDVKQSIYRFRLARPELFMEKYNTYSMEDNTIAQRVDLDRNFRSRREVLNFANLIFSQIMRSSLGKIEYDEKAALYLGNTDMEEPENEKMNEPEVILVAPDMEALSEENEELTLLELEAKAVACRIKRLLQEQQVLDKETNALRPARFGDMVILLRAISGPAEVFTEILKQEGIPSYTGTSSGYFNTLEIQTILNYLKVVSNKRQELPLTAVLHAPFGNMSAEELAKIKIFGGDVPFYTAAERYAREGEEDALREKLAHFYEQLERFRFASTYLSIYDLLTKILKETGYGDYLQALPGGVQRKANADMLLEKAIAFEATSYHGLFQFIRYMEQLQKYEIDFGEANILSEQEDTVRIMSIHKSKGLEFPIVFVCGLGKGFNKMDIRSKLVLHPVLGVGVDDVDPQLRTKTPTLLKRVIQQETDLENMGEELRVLYVALTRAKEKLILTGSTKKPDKLMKKCQLTALQKDKALRFLDLAKAGNYLEWLLPALSRYPDAALVETETLEMQTDQELEAQVEKHLDKESLLTLDLERVYDEELEESLQKRFSYVYPYEKEMELPIKLSVSELKKKSREEEEEAVEALYTLPEPEAYVPEFMREASESRGGGARKGNAYHKVLECMDWGQVSTAGDLDALLKRLVAEEKLQEEDAALIFRKDILSFLKSDLGKRMERAAGKGQLFCEQPFVLGVPAQEIKASYESGAMVLIQGIIDVLFYEGEDIVLVDYKTDRVQQEEELLKRYQGQLDYYEKALRQITEKQVKERWIYSFALGKAIAVP